MNNYTRLRHHENGHLYQRERYVDGKVSFVEQYDKDGNLHLERWYDPDGGLLYRGEKLPSQFEYYETGVIRMKVWMRGDELHRETGPARIWYNEDGTRSYESWSIDGESFDIGALKEYIDLPKGVKVEMKLVFGK